MSSPSNGDQGTSPSLVKAVLLTVLGFLLTFAGIALGYEALRFPSSPDGFKPEIGVAVTLDGRPVDGVELRSFISGNGCSGLQHVSIIAAPTDAFWTQHRAHPANAAYFRASSARHLPGVARVAIAVTTSGVDRPHLYQGSIQELLVGVYATPTGTSKPYRTLFHAGTFRRVGSYWVGAAGLLAWPETHTPLVVSFMARWMTARSPGSCYIHVPGLIGAATYQATSKAAQALAVTSENPHGYSGGIAAGFSNPVVGAREIVSVGGGLIDASATTPPPNVIDSDDYVGWQCSRPRSTGPLGVFPTGLYRIYQGNSAPAPVAGAPVGGTADCSAIAVVDSGAQFRDGELLGAGVLIPLGIGLILIEGTNSVVQMTWGAMTAGLRRLFRRRRPVGR